VIKRCAFGRIALLARRVMRKPWRGSAQQADQLLFFYSPRPSGAGSLLKLRQPS